MPTIPHVSGHCYCGAITFTVQLPEDRPPIFAAYCHCDSCRRAHAAPLYQVACVEEAQFTLTTGAEHLRDFTRPGGQVCRAFCDVCGTRVLNRFPGWLPRGTPVVAFFPNTLDVADLASLPGALAPTKHLHVDECVLDREMVMGLWPEE